MASSTEERQIAFKHALDVYGARSDRQWFEEPYGAKHVTVAQNVWARKPPFNDPTGAVSQGLAVQEVDFALTLDPFSAGRLWVAKSLPGTWPYTGPLTDWTTLDAQRARNWISPIVFGPGYSFILKQGNGALIATGNWEWHFSEGLLHLDDGNTAADKGWVTPLKLTCYRYAGPFLTPDVAGLVSETTGEIVLLVDPATGSDVPTPTRPARVTVGDHLSEPFATVEAAEATLPDLIRHETRLKLSAGEHGGIQLYGKIIGGYGGVPAALIIEPDSSTTYVDFTPSHGPASGVITSASEDRVVVAGAMWAPGSLRGRGIEIEGDVYAILDNSEDTLDLNCNDTSWITPGTAFTLKDWAVKLSRVGVTNVRGRVEMSGLKILYGVFSPKNCSDLYLEECLLAQGVGVLDCTSVEFQNVASSGYYCEVAQVDNFQGDRFGSNVLMNFKDCLGFNLSSPVSLGGLYIFGCINAYVDSILSRCDSFSCVMFYSRIEFSGYTVIINAGANAISVGDGCFVKLGGDFSGYGNSGYGLAVWGPDSWVFVGEGAYTLTGTDGDAAVDMESPMAWADLWDIGGDEHCTMNLVTGSKIYTPVHA